MKELRQYFDAFLLLMHPESDSRIATAPTHLTLSAHEPLPSGLAQALQNIGLLTALMDPISMSDDERPTLDA